MVPTMDPKFPIIKLVPKAVFEAPTWDLISASLAAVAATVIPIKKKVARSAHLA